MDFSKSRRGGCFIGSLTLLFCENYKILSKLCTEFNEFFAVNSLIGSRIDILKCWLSTIPNIHGSNGSAFTAWVYDGLL